MGLDERRPRRVLAGVDLVKQDSVAFRPDRVARNIRSAHIGILTRSVHTRYIAAIGRHY